ncbi:AAA family ATPase [Gilliamella sp. B3464]|uniref:ExeA family protein n=1 Tax=unclassified Gilliamella TaxID=2685620 RepID=UPI002269F2A6|nr:MULTISPECIES: AAA family ATPase [unclassified Gilliamella]MCX8712318.1 AAA family ATPase [Gilliamella sp. B3468]MCX8751136.1 AAA family ATPase [Gilliamella sp. B3464]
MLKLKSVMKQFNIKQAQLAKHIDYKGNSISQAVINQLVNHNIWPRSIKHEELEQKIEKALIKLGLSNDYLLNIFEEETDTAEILADDAVPVDSNENEHLTKESAYMLLRKQTINRDARAHFRIPRDPFTDEMTEDADVYLSDDIRYVRAAMRQTAKHGGMLSVIGESGSGKSTLRHDLIDWININHEPITVIEPYVLGLEDNEVKGKSLKSMDISSAIISAINPQAKPKRSAEARARQMHELLKNSALSGRKHLLIIEEAHGLPIPTLKHLKRFYELQEGFKKLISIILIGQTELQTKLSEYNPEVREVVQRCEVVNLKPLDFKVEEYIKHKFARINMDYTTLFDSSAFNEIINRLRVASTRRGEKQVRSLCYPLAVNNLVSNALNLAARIGAPKVTDEVIVECIKDRGDI